MKGPQFVMFSNIFRHTVLRFFASFPSTRGSLRRRSVQKHHAGAGKTEAKIAYPVPAMQGSQFVVFCSISKHQKEIVSGKGAKTPRGRSENVKG